MSQTIVTNVAIYIKRAEIYQTDKYIKDAFNRNGYGIVSSVTFVEKQGENKQKYNGVLVTMKYWFQNAIVSKLLEEICVVNNETKIYHSNTKYWIIKQYSQPVKENAPINLTIDNNIQGNERVKELELLVNSLSVQITQLQHTQNANKTVIEQFEKKQIHNDLVINDLKCQLHDDNNYMNKCINEARDEIRKLNENNKNLCDNNIELHEQIGHYKYQSERDYFVLLDQEKTFNIVHNEMNDMRNMLKFYDEKKTTEQIE